jgi:hypothetical protein
VSTIPAVRLASLALVALALTACGGSGSKDENVSLSDARAKTTATGSAKFTMSITADLSGTKVTADENGAVSFAKPRAHLYKLVPGSSIPREVIVDGPFTYTNGNVQAALSDPTVRPWTKLDTRKLNATQRAREPDELAHAITPALLAAGVSTPTRVGKADDGTTEFRGTVDPKRVIAAVPAASRAGVATTLRNDYATHPFDARFWLDDQGRVRRVLVDYTTAQGSHFTIDTAYSEFGTAVDRTLPPASEIEDISPK